MCIFQNLIIVTGKTFGQRTTVRICNSLKVAKNEANDHNVLSPFVRTQVWSRAFHVALPLRVMALFNSYMGQFSQFKSYLFFFLLVKLITNPKEKRINSDMLLLDSQLEIPLVKL